MKLSFSPNKGLFPLLPALTLFFCLGLPHSGTAQSCSDILVQASNFRTQVEVQVSPDSKIILLSSYFKGQLSPGCAPGTCEVTYKLTSKLPGSAEVLLSSEAGWLTQQSSGQSISVSPTRDAIQVHFNAGATKQQQGPAFVLRIKVPKSDPCDHDLLRLLDGIVQVDIYVPAKKPALSSGISEPPFPNPCTNQLNWRNASEVAAKYRLLSIEGRVVTTGTIAAGADLKLETSALPQGIYLLECRRKEQPTAMFKVLRTD